MCSAYLECIFTFTLFPVFVSSYRYMLGIRFPSGIIHYSNMCIYQMLLFLHFPQFKFHKYICSVKTSCSFILFICIYFHHIYLFISTHNYCIYPFSLFIFITFIHLSDFRLPLFPRKIHISSLSTQYTLALQKSPFYYNLLSFIFSSVSKFLSMSARCTFRHNFPMYHLTLFHKLEYK